MKKAVSIFMILFLGLVCVTASAQNYGYDDLRWAKSLMDRGDYAYAIRKFADIVRSQHNSTAIKKEAMYYIGYCHVKNNDPWQATRVFERFLKKYDDGISREFIPDALYVLGRIYEETGDQRSAIKAYRRCQRNYPRSSFGRKSAQRLRELNYGGGSNNTDPFDGNDSGNHYDDDYYDDNYYDDGHHDNYHTGISREIEQLLRLAKGISNSFTRDRTLLEGSSRARTGEDFIALAKAINSNLTRGELIEKISSHPRFSEFSPKSMIEIAGFISNSFSRDEFLVELGKNMANRDYVSNYAFVDVSSAIKNDYTRQDLFNIIADSPVFKLMSARTIVDLVKTCDNSFISDEFLVTAAKKCPLTYGDCLTLAEACNSNITRNEILRIANNKDMGNYHSHRRRTNIAEKSDRKPAMAIDTTDPFTDFNFNRSQLSRVSYFIKAVENRKNMKKAYMNLKKSDMMLTTVAIYLEKYKILQKFEDAHNGRRNR